MNNVSLPTDFNTNLLMLFRWMHFLGGVTWIGLLYFFNLVNVPFMKALDPVTKGKVLPSLMSRALFVGTLLFVGPCLSMSWAQNQTEPPQPGPPFPNGSNITFQWDYSCPSGKDCSFICPGGGASHVTKLIIYLGAIPVGSNQDHPAVFYDFSTREISRANGFTISAGLGTLSCQVNGMSLDYSGPPK